MWTALTSSQRLRLINHEMVLLFSSSWDFTLWFYAKTLQMREYGQILSAFQQTICVCMKRKEASGSWLLSVSLFSCNTYPFFWSSDIYLSEISELNKNLETCQWYTTGILILKCENNTIWVMSQKTNVILMTHELTGTVLLSYLLSTRT